MSTPTLKKMNLYPHDIDFDKLKNSFNSASEAMRAYAELDMKATLHMMRGLHKKLYRKPKHNSAFRTVSDRKWAGHRNNKPKHNWGKKRRRLGGWKA